MTQTQVTIAEQIDVAKDLIGERRLDLAGASRMLNALPTEIGDVARSSVGEALQTVAAAERDSRYEALARFALARIVVTLEQHLAEAIMVESPTARPKPALVSHPAT